MTVNADNSITLENPLPTNPDGTTGTGTPVTFDFKLEVDLGEQTSVVFPTTWNNQTTHTTLFQTTDTFALVPKEGTTSYRQYINENFQSLNGWLNQIESTANMITTLYASPNDDYTSLLSATSQEDFKNKSQSSIFNMYGNMDLLTLSNRLSDQDIQSFLDLGEDDLNKVIQTIKELNATISSLQANEALLQDNLSEHYFADNLSTLKAWYTQTTAEIERIYMQWKTQSPTTLGVKDWTQYDSSKTEVYKDASTTLYEQIQGLVTTTEKATGAISQSSQAVKDNSEQFEQLVHQATTTQKDAQNLLANTDNLVQTGNVGVDASKGFYNDFSKTLANTRTTGVNTQGIYNFFANPIAISNVTPKQAKVFTTQKGLDFRFLLVFSIGLVVGVIVMMIGKWFLSKVR